MLRKLKGFEGRFRKWRKGVPVLRGATQETLFGRHQGGNILVHGNAPSAAGGYEFARRMIGADLTIVGMNASPKFVAPDYYVLVDRKATIRYADLIEPEKFPVLISQEALGRCNYELKKSDLQRYVKLRKIGSHPMTLRLTRSPAECISVHFSLAPKVPANAGVVSIWLALRMLCNEREEAGRLIVTGMDGYPIGAGEHHIDPGSPLPGDIMEANLIQSMYMVQLFTMAQHLGIEIWNLNAPHILPVNDLFRLEKYDDEYFTSSA